MNKPINQSLSSSLDVPPKNFPVENKVIGKNNFDKLDRNHDSFYGYINYFNKKRFIGNFIYFLPSKKLVVPSIGSTVQQYSFN